MNLPVNTLLPKEEEFIKKIENLCKEYNMTIFAGAFGVRFIPKDENGEPVVKDNISSYYWNQSFASKELLTQDV